jgi:hypothetical protein
MSYLSTSGRVLKYFSAPFAHVQGRVASGCQDVSGQRSQSQLLEESTIMNVLNVSMSVRLARRIVAAGVLAYACALTLSDSVASTTQASSPTIEFHIINSGGAAQNNGCYRLSGSLGQTAPGYSSAASYSLISGFGAASLTAGADSIFFNSLEAC